MTLVDKKFTQYLKALNPEQRSAVEHIDGPMIVLAGAGTGKTQIIALRIAHLLQTQQLQPQNILCLTFTETGATAMRQRLLEIIGTTAYYVRICTFHSFCNDVIQDHPEQFLFAHHLQALRDADQVTVLKTVLDQLSADSALKPFAAPYFYIPTVRSAIQTLKRENIEIEDYKQLVNTLQAYIKEHKNIFEDFIAIHGRGLTAQQCEEFYQALCKEEDSAQVLQDITALYHQYCEEVQHYTQFKQAIKKYYQKICTHLPKQLALGEVYALYQSQLKKLGQYDYEDMLLFVVNAFENNEQLLAEYQEQYQYILVDEYQDTNTAQNRVVELLGNFFDDPNIFVVGDDRQSIYRFQGASLENILFFVERYKSKVQCLSLRSNYRSHQLILDAAQNVITHNQHSIAQYLPTIETTLQSADQNASLVPIQIGGFMNRYVEYYWVSQHIQSLIKDGVAASEIAVIYRTNRDVDDLLNIFEYLNIPFHLEAGANILQDPHIANLIMLLRNIASLSISSETLFTILQFDFFEIDPLTIMKLLQRARSQRLQLQDIVFDPAQLAAAEVSADQNLQHCIDHIIRWRALSVNTPIVTFFEQLLDDSGYVAFILQQPDKIEHLNRLNSLLDEIKQFHRTNQASRLSDYLEYLTILEEHNLRIDEQILSTTAQAVRLMTAHKAKGLEFQHVFIINCLDKHWGNVPDRSNLRLPPGIITKDLSNALKEQNEDERRLFYVALTRAKEQIYITYPVNSQAGRTLIPSMFITEIDESYITSIDTQTLEQESLERLQIILLKNPQREYSKQERQYITDQLEHYVLSPSHLNDYLQCPRLFFYQDVLRVPQTTTRATAYGTAVHSALEDTVLSAISTKTLPPLDFLLHSFETHLKNQILSNKDFKDSLEFGIKELTSYYEDHQDRLQCTALTEKHFTAEVNGIPITGNIDKIEIIDPKLYTAQVIDYKTGNPDHKQAKLAVGGDYYRQIVFYKLLCERNPQFKFTIATGEIHFIQRSKKTGKFPHKIYKLTAEDTDKVIDQIQQVHQQIKNLEFLHPKPEQLCGECRFCKSK